MSALHLLMLSMPWRCPHGAGVFFAWNGYLTAGVSRCFKDRPCRVSHIPSAPVLKAAPPSGDDWIYEIFRGQLHKAGDDVVIFSRKGGDFTRRFAAVRDSVLSLRRDPQLSTQRSSCATAMASPTLKH